MTIFQNRTRSHQVVWKYSLLDKLYGEIKDSVVIEYKLEESVVP